MGATRFRTVDEYIDSFPANAQEVLRTLRRAVKEAVPGVEERISYKMPAYKRDGWIFYFAAFKSHYSLFVPAPEALFEAFKEPLSCYRISKSTVQFPLDEPVPVGLIRDMAAFRAEANRRAEKPPRPKKKS
ncbi:MAG: iron chaperone [Tepidiformaceae bacterium]